MVGRHAVETHIEDMRLAAAAEQRRPEDEMAASGRVVELALTLAGGVHCPYCQSLRIKNDACMHMDSCPCRGGRFCYACGGRSAGSNVDCPNGSGCDSDNIYLQHYPGFQGLGGNGALREFHRRRTQAIRLKS
jgi:hypothetical protein